MELLTERLILRDFRAEDWPDVLAYQLDPRYLQYYAWTGRTENEVQEFISRFVLHQQQQPRFKFQLAITLKENPQQVIGNCGIRKEAADSHQAEMGYELAPDQWGKGYATEATRAVMRFGFTELRVHRIGAWCIAENRASVRVLEKLGMQQEGRLRDHEYFKGRYWDSLMFGILESEWGG